LATVNSISSSECDHV